MDIQLIGEKLLEAERTKQTIAPLTEQLEQITADEAYDIQLYQIKKKIVGSATVKGLKIGLTSKAMQDMLNVHPPDYGLT